MMLRLLFISKENQARKRLIEISIYNSRSTYALIDRNTNKEIVQMKFILNSTFDSINRNAISITKYFYLMFLTLYTY